MQTRTQHGMASAPGLSRAEPEGPPRRAQPPVIAVGTAPLCAFVAANESGPVTVELALDPKDGRIVGVGATLTLARYSALLCSLLVGCRPDEAEGAVEDLPPRLRGALSGPTIAALANALCNLGCVGSATNGSAQGRLPATDGQKAPTFSWANLRVDLCGPAGRHLVTG